MGGVLLGDGDTIAFVAQFGTIFSKDVDVAEYLHSREANDAGK